jgi:hypothetical protein
MKMAVQADVVLLQWTTTDKERFLPAVEELLMVAEALTMTMMIVVEEVLVADQMMETDVAGMETTKVIQKQLKKAGKIAVDQAAREADHAMTTMTIAAEEVPVADLAADLAMVMVAAGMVITKDIPKLQNVDGKVVVVLPAQEEVHVMKTTMMIVEEEALVVDHAAAPAMVMVADGTVTTKVTQKLLNADGKAVAVLQAQEADREETMMMMIAVEEVHAADHVMVTEEDGSVIRKVTQKLQNADGKAVLHLHHAADVAVQVTDAAAHQAVDAAVQAAVVVARQAVDVVETVDTVAGSVILKVMLKQLNAAGKIAVNL